MSYTIREVSEMMGIPASTLRYYDKKGLLPFVKRGESGYRIFSKENIRTLRLIECLKSTGMTLEQIHTFLGGLCRENRLCSSAMKCFWNSAVQQKKR